MSFSAITVVIYDEIETPGKTMIEGSPGFLHLGAHLYETWSELKMLFHLHGNLHRDFTAASFPTSLQMISFN